MTRRTLAILTALTILVVAAAAFVPGYRGRNVRSATASGPVFKDLAGKIGSVAHLTVGAGATGGGNVTLDRKGEGWTLAEKGDYPADAAKVTAVLNGMAALQFVEAKTDRAALLYRLDLSTDKDGKGRPLEAKDMGDKRVAKLILGKKRPGSLGGSADGVYFRIGDETQAWLGQPAFDLPADQTAWLDHAVPGLDPATVKQVAITQPDGAALTVARPAADKPYAIAALPQGVTAKPDAPLADLGNAAAGFDFQDVAPAGPFQFPATGAVFADLTAFDGTVLHYEMVDRSGGTWARITALGPAAKADPLNAKLKGWVFELPTARAATLKSKLGDLTVPPKAS